MDCHGTCRGAAEPVRVTDGRAVAKQSRLGGKVVAKVMMPIQPGNPMQPSRIRELDSLRGIAAVAVALFHLAYWYGNPPPDRWLFLWGHYGVELFFLISGFVIFMTLERSKSVYDFAVSRVARLYPAYWVAVALTSIVAYAAFPRWDSAPPSFGVVLVNLTMLQRFFMVGEIDKSYWTLAIELSFYVAIAAAFKARLMSRIEVPCII
jgi:peptidoglycan/LPS O-acetylase OafA/YrhL